MLDGVPDGVGGGVQGLRVREGLLGLDGFLERLEHEQADVLDVLGRRGVAHGVIVPRPGGLCLILPLGHESHLSGEVCVARIALHHCVRQCLGGVVDRVQTLFCSSSLRNGCNSTSPHIQKKHQANAKSKKRLKISPQEYQFLFEFTRKP